MRANVMPAARGERIIAFILRTWGDNPRLRYIEVQTLVMSTFAVGESVAQHSLALARKVLNERVADSDLPERIVEAYWRIFDNQRRVHERAMATGRLADARQALVGQRDTLRALAKHLGLGAPERVEISGHATVSIAVAKFRELSSTQLEALAELDIEDNAQDTTAPATTGDTT